MAVRRLRYAVPDRIEEPAFVDAVRSALRGNADPASAAVVWEDFGDQLLVHLDSIVVKLLPRFIIISVDCETDQTGRAPLIVTFALASLQDGAGLVAATDELARGQPLLAARWSRILQETLWAALLNLLNQHATERGKVPLSLHALGGHLRLRATAPLALDAAALNTFDAAFPGLRKENVR